MFVEIYTQVIMPVLFSNAVIISQGNVEKVSKNAHINTQLFMVQSMA